MDGKWIKQHSATRPPDWRWRQASDDARRWRVRLRADADFETRILAKCLMLLADVPAEARITVDMMAECKPYLEIQAWRENRDLAARIEAIALSRLPFGYIANELGLDRENVRRYCFAFFDIWDRLEDRDFIIRHCVAPELRRGDPASARRRTAMKLLAYLCGPAALEDLFGMFGKPNGAWRPPAEAFRCEAALLEVDRMAGLIAGGEGSDAGLTKESLEACVAALEQYCRDTYPEHQLAWKVNLEPLPTYIANPFACGPEDAPSIDAPPHSLSKAKQKSKGKNGGKIIIWQEPPEPTEKQGPAAKICASFLGLGHDRVSVPAQAIGGAEIDPNWNARLLAASPKAAAWAKRQLATHAADDLYESTLFERGPDGKPRLISGFAQAGATIVSLCPRDAKRPSGFYVTDWPADAPAPVAEFVADEETRRLAEASGGALIAARNAGEVAAWRRMGIAAIPTPQSSSAAKSWSAKLWAELADMQLVPSPETQAMRAEMRGKNGRGAPVPEAQERTTALEQQLRIKPTLIATVWDPLAREPRPNDETLEAVAMLREFWKYRSGPDAAVALWAPPIAYLQVIRESVEGGSPTLLRMLLRTSLQHHLFYPRLPQKEASPSDGLVSARRRLAAVDAATSMEERERARRQYIEHYENAVVEPLLREAATTSSPDDRMLTALQAHMVGQFAEVHAAATLGLAGGHSSPRLQSATVTNLCRLSAEARNLMRTKDRSNATQN